jgi:hypothetical protein
MELGLEVPLNITILLNENLQGATKYNHPFGGGVASILHAEDKVN